MDLLEPVELGTLDCIELVLVALESLAMRPGSINSLPAVNSLHFLRFI